METTLAATTATHTWQLWLQRHTLATVTHAEQKMTVTRQHKQWRQTPNTVIKLAATGDTPARASVMETFVPTLSLKPYIECTKAFGNI